MGKEHVLWNAGICAVLVISWRNHKNIVKDFIRTSSGLNVDSPTRSWCGDFAYWVLMHSGITPMVGLAKPVTGGWDTVSRFGKLYQTFKPGEGTPQPGDMFYMKYTTAANKQKGYATHHVGFVVEFQPGKPTFTSVDGNTGNDPSILVKGIGGGYCSYNYDRSVTLVDYFIRIPG